MRKIKVLFVSVLSLCGLVCLCAGEIQMTPRGIIQIDDFEAGLAIATEDFSLLEQSTRACNADKGFPLSEGKNLSFKGSLASDKFPKPCPIFIDVLELSNDSFKIKANIESSDPLKLNNVALNISLPVEKFGGQKIILGSQEITLPIQSGEFKLFGSASVNSIKFTGLRNYSIEGSSMSVELLDRRVYKSDNFNLRIQLQNIKDSLKNFRSASLEFTLNVSDIDSFPLSLASVANRAFADEKAGDGQGGWTDQGPANDLRMFKPGMKNFKGVKFNILDPAKNNGKSCLVLDSVNEGGIKEATIKVPAGRKDKFLYLLHACAWKSKASDDFGSIIVEYADSEKAVIPVVKLNDIADWWAPIGIDNGAVVWTADNASAYVGLYMSRFQLAGKEIKSITLKGNGAVWLIPGASLSDTEVSVKTVSNPVIIIQDKDWKLYDYPERIAKDSIMDFSFVLDAPAGKYGPLAIRDGHFEFKDRPGKRARFYGTNLSFTALYLSKENCETLADIFARTGYNCIRFQHMESLLTKKDAQRSTDFDPEQLDKLDYLFYCLKKRGIYITHDLYINRVLRPGELPGFDHLKGSNGHNLYYLKALVTVYEPALENWKEFARKFLLHKNPYTGMVWGEDPAHITSSLLNENDIFGVSKEHPEIEAFYDKCFSEYLAEKKIDEKSLSKAEKASLMATFKTDAQRNAVRKMMAFIRDELKLNFPISDNNFVPDMLQTITREDLDYVDQHPYWDHPRFPKVMWQMPMEYSNTPAVKRSAYVPRKVFSARITGKPFFITEFNYTFPNRYRAEGGPLIGAYASLQDWDGLFRFIHSHSDKKMFSPATMHVFDVCNDPINIIADKIAILLFVRGDVKKAEKRYTLLYSRPDWLKSINTLSESTGVVPDSYTMLGLCSGIGSLNIDKYDAQKKNLTDAFGLHPLGSGIKVWDDAMLKSLVTKESNPDEGLFVSDTGELRLDSKNQIFTVNTPATVIVYGVEAESVSSGLMDVKGSKTSRMVSASAMDGKELKKSDRILMFHLTNVLNSNMKFANEQMRLLTDSGKLPFLVKEDNAEISLALDNPSGLKVKSLKSDGSVRKEIPSRVEGGKLIFNASTGADGGTLAYEISR